MKIKECLESYNLLPTLVIHMVKVAALALYLNRKLGLKLDEDIIVKACAFHDLGKMTEIKLGAIPGTLGNKSIEEWRKIQDGLIEKYGRKEIATRNMAKEIGLDAKVVELIFTIGFGKGRDNLESGEIEKMLCCYCDQRVSPYGIATLKYRMMEGRAHFVQNNNLAPSQEDNTFFDDMAEVFCKIEEKLFEKTGIAPDGINEQDIGQTIVEVENWMV